jgi:sporulation protein YlmC with PRC-barrel domain
VSPAGRRIWAVLELLDRQIVDRRGELAGKVDDLELEVGDGPDALPVVTAILSGPGAIAGRIGGETGRWLAAMEARLLAPGQQPSRIAFELVRRIESGVEIDAAREDLDSDRGERWARDVIIDKIPGARHEAE